MLLSKVPVPRARATSSAPPASTGARKICSLGLGSDGHTASLFPGKATLAENMRWVVSSTPGVLPPPVDRVTFTLPVLDAARSVVFLVAGADKTVALSDVLSGSSSLPAAMMRPPGGVRWLVDRAAYARLAALPDWGSLLQVRLHALLAILARIRVRPHVET